LYGILFMLTAWVPLAWASPIPASGTSILTSNQTGLYFSIKGFHLGTEGTQWLPHEDRSLNRGDEGTSWRFINSQDPSAQANLKTDYLKTEMTLEAYAKRWMKDYSHLGLDVLGTRAFALGNTRGVVVDLIQPQKKLQMRQAVFMHKRSVVILTCSDDQKKFPATLEECNRLIKNFSWNEVAAPLKN